MKTATRIELHRALGQDQFEPLYLLIGCEGYLRDESAREISDSALRDTLIREFNESTFSLLNGGPQSAIAAAEQLPMMSTRRVVQVKDFSKMRETDEAALIRYLKNPAPSSVMIFNTAELDKRRLLTKALLESCLVVECPALKDGEAMKWVRDRLKSLKITADNEALSDLIMLVGTDLQTLQSELDKLASAAGDSKRITLAMVGDLIGRSRELSNFELGDHLMSRNRKAAVETLHRLLEGGAEPLMLLGLLASNYHRLALAKEALKHGSTADVFKTVPVPFFKRDAFINTLRRSEADKIAHGLKLIAAADLAIKTSQATPRLQIEMLVCELAA
ncbi:MAG TPA: DNA polymerase III subunit delta [Pyrinomonadaceae bacterium]|nr:DNA polymerase III subunit delta [Pyrinomonadaceae bacterium]